MNSEADITCTLGDESQCNIESQPGDNKWELLTPTQNANDNLATLLLPPTEQCIERLSYKIDQ